MTTRPNRHDAALVALGRSIYGETWQLPASLSGTMPAPERKLTPEGQRIHRALQAFINDRWPNRDVATARALFDALHMLQQDAVVEMIARQVDLADRGRQP